MTTRTVTGATITLTSPSPNMHTATQHPPSPTSRSSTLKAPIRWHIPLSWSHGPLTVTGSVDPSTLGLEVDMTVLGISFGSFEGNLKGQEGVSVIVDLAAGKGTVGFYVKGGSEVWGKAELKVEFEGEEKWWKNEVKLVRWGRGGNDGLRFKDTGLRHFSAAF